MPPAKQVREELERILKSEVFARSGRARDLLLYIVEQDLAGNADRLKGFAIAIDVFGKGPDFDPANDTVVRVQMGRLRDFLTQYYQGPGADAEIRITIQRGSYVPVYQDPDWLAGDAANSEPSSAPRATEEGTPASGATSSTVPTTIASGSPGSTRSSLWALAAAVVLALGVIFYGIFFAPAEAPVDVAGSTVGPPNGLLDTTGSVPQEALPSIFLDVGPDDASKGVAALLRRGIAGFDTVNLIARAPTPEVQGAHLRTDFVFAVHEHGPGSVLLEVQNVASGKVLLSTTIDSSDAVGLEDRVADILSTLVPASGVIYASIVEADSQTDLVRCLVLNDRFYRGQSAETHRAAYECLERLVAMGSNSAIVYSELGSLNIQAQHNRYDYPTDASAENALELARQAVQYGPNSPYAHRSMGYVLSRTASVVESLRWTQKAYELNTFDLGMAASYGYAKLFAGNYEDGTPILQSAVSAASAHPTWWDYGLFLGHFMNGDNVAAANAVSALGASDRAHYIAARLIAAHSLGNSAAVVSLVNELLENHVTFASDPLAFYRKANYPADMCSRLVAALSDAGLGRAS